MRRVLAISLIYLLLLPAQTRAARPRHLDSIRPLNVGSQGQCTAWSLNQRLRLWVTAAHCIVMAVDMDGVVSLEPYAELNIAGTPVTAWQANLALDLALLQADLSAPALKLGPYPREGHEVTVYGYPGGWQTPLEVWLRVSNPFVKLYDHYWMILDGHVWPGHSGSPVLDRKGRVIAVVQAHGTDRYAGMTFVSPWSALKQLGEGYWE